MAPLNSSDEQDRKRSLAEKSAALRSAGIHRTAEHQRNKLMKLAESEGVSVSRDEKFHLMTTLISSTRGVIRLDDPDYAKKLAQWQHETREAL